MTVTLRRSQDRGFFNFGWLETYHSFSFGNYHDENHMGFRTLRVINQDIVQPGRGFDTHAHHDMEIITYVLKGALIHKDTMGNETVIHAGEIQCMSAGSGVRHSEYNQSTDEVVELLQIWILPDQKGLMPTYQQKAYANLSTGLQLLAAPKGMDGLISINQKAKLFRGVSHALEAPLNYTIDEGHHIWVQMISGQAMLGEQLLEAGDGASISQQNALKIVPKSPIELLLFDL
jgi:redox-sensitive bicupin YhaK (pirin superfamily)